MTIKTLRIATRQSPLALWQAEFVKAQLHHYWPKLDITLVPMRTSGDKFLNDTLAAVGGKGLFVKELELALLEQRADIAVHSLKDVPAQLPAGLLLSTFLQREDPRDALVSDYQSLDALPHGALIGTASLRRHALIKHYYPHLNVAVLRGNINSRLKQLANGHYDAIMLAVAGLTRLGLEHEIAAKLDSEQFVPAVGQGVLALECRADDLTIQALLVPLHHADTTICVTAERAFNERLGGACHVPVAAYATLDSDTLHLMGLVAKVDGTECLRESISGPIADACKLGTTLANTLLNRGADTILNSL